MYNYLNNRYLAIIYDQKYNNKKKEKKKQRRLLCAAARIKLSFCRIIDQCPELKLITLMHTIYTQVCCNHGVAMAIFIRLTTWMWISCTIVPDHANPTVYSKQQGMVTVLHQCPTHTPTTSPFSHPNCFWLSCCGGCNPAGGSRQGQQIKCHISLIVYKVMTWACHPRSQSRCPSWNFLREVAQWDTERSENLYAEFGTSAPCPGWTFEHRSRSWPCCHPGREADTSAGFLETQRRVSGSSSDKQFKTESGAMQGKQSSDLRC